ncbi:exopolyphosphatase [Bartonella sp. DGB2]|uniref:Ppx/GppA phosphatase family protein n=1 Tax=Bartonella sp. DGB2 TaxID=3388426 RepID=UPI00398F9841
MIDRDAQDKPRGHAPVAVIDIGSNSVRLVVYECRSRVPKVLYNEKALCGLGKNLVKTTRLDEQAVAMALGTLKRFALLCRHLGALEIYTLATAAVREAQNGTDFITDVSAILGKEAIVLSGEEEALYSAYGVMSSFFRPCGIVGDLGGGSLELVDISRDTIGDGLTLPLGGLRLKDMSLNDLNQAGEIAHQHLKNLSLLSKASGQNFYAVGGTWRNLAKLHMATKDYPLPIMHGYEVNGAEMYKFLQKIRDYGLDSLQSISSISKNRRQLLAYGAQVLEAILAYQKPEKLLFSGAGVREGFLFSQLSKKQRAQDPLLAACEEFASLQARSQQQVSELITFSDRTFDAFGIVENENEYRYRKAACLLIDVAWRLDADYRGSFAACKIALGSYLCISHLGRIYAALSAFYCHEGLNSDTPPPDFISLASDAIIQKASILGGILRLANVLSPAASGILPKFSWRKKKHALQLHVPADYRDLIADRPHNRLRQLAKFTGLDLSFSVGDSP